MDRFSIQSVLNIVNDFVPMENASIAVSDEKQFIYYQPSKQIDLKIQPGDIINTDTITYKALSDQKKVSEHVDNNSFGIPYFGVAVPIMDGDKPKGVVTTILPSKPLLLSTSFLTVKTNDRWMPIPNDEIMYLEAQNRKTRIQSSRVNGFHKLNLSELELVLPTDNFIRVHRSYIVNIHFIEEILPDFHSTFLLVMKDKSKIQVSQTYASQFRRALGF
ncbi:LytTR family transcriptional regulator [Peribacillus asahii]|uniref:LytTR family transcriptional regulator n=1 Tax=Peribacillus asahii TaxID=228899 RepID=A0A398BEF3_9BACI|nr:LytTR family DNA-binding domain-containing protein [Peribacillus asahii]RID88719.1 LytTR family transcriptional regulator [Peribacillus asahii]